MTTNLTTRTDLIERMRSAARSDANVFILCVDDYRTFVSEWLAAPGPLREAVPTMFEGAELVVSRDANRSYALKMFDHPELWIL